MSDQLPGVTHIDLHEGRWTGPFDLPPADMAQVRYQGRVMAVVVADILDPLTIVTTKDGDVKAKWTFKAVDIALVRDEGMQKRLADTLHMIGLDDDFEDDEPVQAGPEMVGVYDEEGAFLGFEPVEREVIHEVTRVDVTHVDHETGEILEDEPEPEPERKPLFRKAAMPDEEDDGLPPVSERETFGRPIRHDDALSNFLDEKVPA